MITAAFIREHLDYDPDTGHLTYRKSGRGVSKGSRAGGLNKRGYRDVHIAGKDYAEHRIVWLWVHGSFPSKTIDHINRVRTDNRLCNLREATVRDQACNRTICNKSGLPKGVKLLPSGRYSAQLQHQRQHQHLGTYNTPEEAHAAYCAAAKAAYGEFFFSG
jgi:hypothetical protein